MNLASTENARTDTTPSKSSAKPELPKSVSQSMRQGAIYKIGDFDCSGVSSPHIEIGYLQ